MGRFVKWTNDVANGAKDMKIAKYMSEAPAAMITAISAKLKSRNMPAYTKIANQLDNLSGKDEKQRMALMHMLMKQGSVKQAIQSTIKEMRDETEIAPEDDMVDKEDSAFLESSMDEGREPAGVYKDINWDLKNEIDPTVPLMFLKNSAKRESAKGKYQGLEPLGNTVGIFHIKRDIALEVAPPEEADLIKNMTVAQFNDWIKSDTNREYKYAVRVASKKKKEIENKIGADLNFLSESQLSEVLDYAFNAGTNKSPKLISALANAAKATDESTKNFYLDEVRRQMDANKETVTEISDTEDGGQELIKYKRVSPGLESRREENRGNFDIRNPLEENYRDPSLNFNNNIEKIKNDLERIMVQRGSGEKAPLSQLDNLMDKVNRLRVSQEDKNDIEREAVAMNSPQDFRNLLKRLQNLS